MVNMMWATSLLILISVAGSVSGECLKEMNEQCNLQHHRANAEFPNTPGELMTFCQNVKTLGSCVGDVKENCEDTDNREIASIRKAVDYLDSTCDEDSNVFKAISSNLQCIKSTMNATNLVSCLGIFSDENWEIVESHLLPIFEDYKSDLAYCLDNMLDVRCPSTVLGYYCGEEVKYAAEDILINVDSKKYIKCSAEILAELEPVLEIFEGIMHEELELKNSVEKRK